MNTLAKRLNQKNILKAPGVYDALTASIATDAGFECLYLSGAAVAYTKLGKPDIGLTSVSEMADTMTLISERVETPVIMDADTGFGNALNAQRTMQQYERAGASALQVEDQQHPKKCGHLADKKLINVNEMCGKISAMVDARKQQSTLVIARTDAIAVEGFAAAMDRAQRYQESGADVLFIEAPETVEQLTTIGKTFGGSTPLLANMVEGGTTPIKSADDLEQLGFSIVIYPGGIVRALAKTAIDYYASLQKHGSTKPFANKMFDFNGLNEVIGTKVILDKGKQYSGES